MSEYFQALKRLKSQEPLEPVRAEEERPIVRRSAAVRSRTALVESSPAEARRATAEPPAPSTPLSPGFLTMMNNLRALTNGLPTRGLVFATAAAAESVRPLTGTMAAQAARLNHIVRTAQLSTNGGVATVRCSGPSADALRPLTVGLHNPSWEGEFAAWLREASTGAELVVVEAPSLETSIDGALLASGCDGLVIVAKAEVTPREALRAAAERARLVGCRPLGIVLHRTHDRIPGWLRRLTGRPANKLED